MGLKRIDSWTENKNMRVGPQIGETAIVVRPDVAPWTNNKIADERALGRYCATVIRGQLDTAAHSKVPAILLEIDRPGVNKENTLINTTYATIKKNCLHPLRTPYE
jgi:hypothetical protein